jgi:hypothetical protein
MKRLLLVCGAGLMLVGAAAAAGWTFEPPAGEAKKPEPARSAMIMPGTEKFYEPLAARVGTWDVTARFWLAPGAEVQETACTGLSTMVLGGAFLEERLTGGKLKMGESHIPWDAISHTAYDAAKQEYTVNRMSSTCPTFMPEAGTYDEEKKELETVGDFSLMYMKVKVRTITRQQGPDERTVEQHMSFNGSPEWKGIELVMKRRK